MKKIIEQMILCSISLPECNGQSDMNVMHFFFEKPEV